MFFYREIIELIKNYYNTNILFNTDIEDFQSEYFGHAIALNSNGGNILAVGCVNAGDYGEPSKSILNIYSSGSSGWQKQFSLSSSVTTDVQYLTLDIDSAGKNILFTRGDYPSASIPVILNSASNGWQEEIMQGSNILFRNSDYGLVISETVHDNMQGHCVFMASPFEETIKTVVDTMYYSEFAYMNFSDYPLNNSYNFGYRLVKGTWSNAGFVYGWFTVQIGASYEDIQITNFYIRSRGTFTAPDPFNRPDLGAQVGTYDGNESTWYEWLNCNINVGVINSAVGVNPASEISIPFGQTGYDLQPLQFLNRGSYLEIRGRPFLAQVSGPPGAAIQGTNQILRQSLADTKVKNLQNGDYVAVPDGSLSYIVSSQRGKIVIRRKDTSHSGNWYQAEISTGNVEGILGGGWDDEFGRAIAVNKNADKIIISTYLNNTSENPAALIYKKNFSPSVAGGWQLEQILTGTSYSDFGSSVAINGVGNRIVVGAPLYDDDPGDGHDPGRIEIFTSSSSGWIREHVLDESINFHDNCEHFGCSVAINEVGTRIIVGAKEYDDRPDNAEPNYYEPGLAFAYTSSSGGWVRETYFRGPLNPDNPYYYFGQSIAIDSKGERIAVGAPGYELIPENISTILDDTDIYPDFEGQIGAVFVYDYKGSHQQETVDFSNTPPINLGTVLTNIPTVQSGTIYDNFQLTVTPSNNYFSPFLEEATIFGEGIKSKTYIISPAASGAIMNGSGGQGIKIEGDVSLLLAGNRLLHISSSTISSSIPFNVCAPGPWILRQTINGSLSVDPKSSEDEFSATIAMNWSGNRIIVGAENDERPDQDNFHNEGLAYIFTSGSAGWIEEAILSGSFATEENDWFGDSVDINADGNRVIIGAPQDHIPIASFTTDENDYIFRMISNSPSGWDADSSVFDIYKRSYFTIPADNYLFTLTDNYSGDSWVYGNTRMELRENGNLIHTFGTDYNYGTPETKILFSLTSSMTYSLEWTVAGDFPEQIGIKITDSDGNNIYQLNSGTTPTIPLLLHSWIAQTGSGYVLLEKELDQSIDFLPDSWTLKTGSIYYKDIQISLSENEEYSLDWNFSGSNPTLASLQIIDPNETIIYTLNSGSVPPSYPTTMHIWNAVTGTGGWTVYYNNPNDLELLHGLAYVFTSGSTGWTEEAILSSSNIDDNDNFGSAVAINANGNMVVVGGNLDSYGSAYIFTSSSSGWNLEAELTGVYQYSYDDNFGLSVATNATGNIAVIGAWGSTRLSENNYTQVGLAYVFSKDANNWTLQQILSGSGSNLNGGQFGYSVSIDANGNTIVVGAKGGSDCRAFVFTSSSNGWTESGVLRAETTLIDDDEFGYAVKINASGNCIVVGDNFAEYKNITDDYGYNSNAGLAFIFLSGSNGWYKEERRFCTLAGRFTYDSDNFGSSVAINAAGDRIAIGAYDDERPTQDNSEDEGLVYIYDNTTNIQPPLDFIFNTQSVSLIDNTSTTVTIQADDVEECVFSKINLSVVSPPNGLFTINKNSVYLAPNSADLSSQISVGFTAYEIGDVFGTLVATNNFGTKIVNLTGSGIANYKQLGSVLTASSTFAQASDQFGYSLAINAQGNLLVIGALDDERTSQSSTYNEGLAYIYASGSTGWRRQTILSGSLAISASDNFGSAVAINSTGNRVAIGAWKDERQTQTITTSTIYTFRLTDTYGDGWNGARMELRTGSTVVQTFGSTFTTGLQQDITVSLVSGSTYSLVWTVKGSFPTEVGVRILDPSGANIYTRNPGTNPTVPLTLHTWNAISGSGTTITDGANASGVAYVFTSGSNGWIQEQILSGSLATGSGDNFGVSIAMNASGDRVVVGANFDERSSQVSSHDEGLVYVFNSGSSGWTQNAILSGSLATQTGDWFGTSVAINASGNIIVVGSNQDERNDYPLSNHGLAYVFVSGTNGWAEQQILSGSLTLQATGVDWFGYSIALNESGDRIVIGARQDERSNQPPDHQEGLVYIFDYNGTMWIETHILSGSLAVNSADLFGQSVAINSIGDRVIVGARADESVIVRPANLYTFRLTDTYGDGWNGATVQVREVTGSIVVATMGSTFTNGAGPIDIDVELTQGKHYELYFNNGGSYPSEVRVQIIDPNYNAIYTQNSSLAAGTVMHQWIAQTGSGEPIQAAESSGLVYIFTSGSNGWKQQQILSSSLTANIYDYFGHSVTTDASGKIVAVGAIDDETSVAGSGVVQMFSSSL